MSSTAIKIDTAHFPKYHVYLIIGLHNEEGSRATTSGEVKEWVELYFHSPNTPSWRSA